MNTIQIPKQDRATLDYPRIYSGIPAQPHPGRYQPQTRFGILDRWYATADTNRVPPLISIYHYPF